MRLVRVGMAGAERPGVMVSDREFVDVGHLTDDFDGAFFACGGLARLEPEAARLVADGRSRRIGGLRLGPPIARPHQILCIGLNYRDHAEETGQAIPAEPILFTKAPNTLVGPNDDVQIPLRCTKTDYEIELGIVIGLRAHYLTDLDAAAKSIVGYVLVNDVSERAFQLEHGGQWSEGKSCATFNPCGPYLVTRNEVGDPQNLDMWLDVNGERRQSGNTRTMLFDVLNLVHYLSQFMVLEPGDLINTGTPPGVGIGMTPPTYLREGDIVELGIPGLGQQRQQLVAATARPVAG